MLMAGDVPLLDSLKKPLGAIGAKSQGSLADALGRLRTQARTSNTTSGRVQGTYQDESLDRANTMASRGINDSLYASLGGSSYDELQKQKEFERQMALAKEIGDRMQPSMGQEILGGLSQGVNLAGKGKGIYDVLGEGRQRGGSNPLSMGRLSGYQPDMASYPPPYDSYTNYTPWNGSY